MVGVLARLSERNFSTAAELAEAARVSPQVMVVTVCEMERLGMISTTPDEGDRRRVLLALTETGRERLRDERLSGPHWLHQAIAENLTRIEREALAAALAALRKLAETSTR